MPKSLRKIDNKIIECEILKDNPINAHSLIRGLSVLVVNVRF